MTLPEPRYDPETGTLTYFDPADGDGLRRAWIDEHVPAAFAELTSEDHRIRWAALVAAEGIPTSKPTMADRVTVALVASPTATAEQILEALRGDDESNDNAWKRLSGIGAKFPVRWEDEELIALFSAYCSPRPPGLSRPQFAVLGYLEADNGDASFHDTMTPLRPWLDGCRSVIYPGAVVFDPTVGDRRRAEFVADQVLPYVAARFAEHPALRSASLLVAQYWDDNASDEVMGRFAFSELETPDLTDHRSWWGSGRDIVNRPTVGALSLRSVPLPPAFNATDGLIALFAAFCREGCTQDDDPWESFSPYAIFRRSDQTITTDIVGVNRRPWLDGRRIECWTSG